MNITGSPDNKKYLDKLLSLKGTTIVPFIGAGFSVPVCLTWADFLEEYYQNVREEFFLEEDEEQYRKLKEIDEANKYELMADSLINTTNRRRFEEEIRTHFIKPVSSQISEKFRLLHSAFPGLKITTNFDCLIEDSATTHVVGRDKELQEIRKRLEVDRGTVQMISGRLFSLEGIGGVGKTTLAIEVARKYSSLFSDGVLPLIRVDEETPSTLAMKIAKYFNIKLEEPPDSQTAQHQITFILKNRNALLILDNAVDWQSLRYMLPNHCSHMT